MVQWINTLYNLFADGVFEIASYAFCILVMDRIGRKFMLCFMFLLAGIGLLASAIVNEYSGDNQCRFK